MFSYYGRGGGGPSSNAPVTSRTEALKVIDAMGWAVDDVLGTKTQDFNEA